jgi:ribosome maturation factor RimP
VERKGDELYELTRDLVQQMGYTLLRVDDVVERGRRLFRFYVDHPRGITLADCEAVSREIEYVLDADFDFGGSYVLEVSSPGLDHELKTERDYSHFAGRPARLVLRESVEGKNVVEGVIAGAGEGRVRIGLPDGTEIIVPLAGIARARLAIEERRRDRAAAPDDTERETGSNR